MKGSTRPARGLLVAVVAAVLALSTLAAGATVSLAGGSHKATTPTPDGYKKYLVYMANGVFDPNDPNYTPPSGSFFFHHIMGWNNAQIAQSKADAIAFFNQRFGVDFSQGDQVGNITLTSFMFDPRNNYRAYTISGETVPSSGWVVRDGGWQLAVGSGGTTFTGEYGGAGGTAVPAGTIAVFGNYNILRDTATEERAPIILHYQSHTPIVPNPLGGMSFQCEISSPQFGTGFAQGFVGPAQQLSGGLVKMDVRNVLTFPGY